MQGKYHFVCACAAGTATAIAFYDSFEKPVLSISLLIIGSCVGGLIPDIDSPTSTIGKPLKFVSKLINKVFGHRTITHSGLWLIPLLILCFKWKDPLSIGYTLGFVSHLISDTMTSGGVAWLYPLEKKRLRLTRIRSGDGDMILTILCTALFALGNFAVKYYILS